MKTKKYTIAILAFINIFLGFFIINTVNSERAMKQIVNLYYNIEIEQIEMGNGYVAAVIKINNEERLYEWGRNSEGQIGTGSTASYINKPTLVYTSPEGTTIEQISAGDHSMAMVINDGTTDSLYTWGWNNYGQLGYDTGSTNAIRKPREVSTVLLEGGGQIDSINIGLETTFMITSDDTNQYLYGWGRNSSGELGNGTTTTYQSPKLLWTLPYSEYNVVDLDQNGASSLLLLDSANSKSSTIFVAGNNTYGQLGIDSNISTTINTWSPSYTTEYNTKILDVSSGSTTSYFVTESLTGVQTLYVMGNNASGQFGNGTTTSNFIPQQTPVKSQDYQISSLNSSASGTVTLLWKDQANTFYLGWGDNSYGQLGTGEDAEASYSSPELLVATNNLTQNINITALSAINSLYVVDNYNVPADKHSKQLNYPVELVYIAGSNNYGQYGIMSEWSTVIITQSPTLIAEIFIREAN